MAKKKAEDKRGRGRPLSGITKKDLAVCVKAESRLKEIVFSKFGGWQRFFDHHLYKLVPKSERPK